MFFRVYLFSIRIVNFETGIKVIDLLTFYERGGKIDLFDDEVLGFLGRMRLTVGYQGVFYKKEFFRQKKV